MVVQVSLKDSLGCVYGKTDAIRGRLGLVLGFGGIGMVWNL